MREGISLDGEFSNNYFMFRLLDEKKVQSYCNAYYQNWENGTVTFKQRDEIHKIYDVTDIVLSVGSASNNSLKEEFEALGIETKVIGDALNVKPGLKNIEESFWLGLSL